MTFRSIQIEKGVPGYAAVNPNANKIYISYFHSDFILIVNIANGSIEGSISANSPRNIVVNQVTNKVYVSSADGIYEIDAFTNKYEVMNFGVPYPHGSVGTNYVTNTLYTTCFGSGDTIMEINLNKKTLTHQTVVSRTSRFSSVSLQGVAVDSSRNNLYISNFPEESIIVFDCKQLDKPIDTIRLSGKWDISSSSPRFILINEISKLLYVHAAIGLPSPAGSSYESLIVFDIDTKKIIEGQLYERPPSHAQEGFAFNQKSNTLYMKKNHAKTVLKLDAYAKEILHTTTMEKTSFWQRYYEGFRFFAHVIAVNLSTNKVYVSDSKNNLLYEIDG